MTYVIDKLEQRDLLSRVACPDDRRMIHVVLTDKGTEMMGQIMPHYHDLVNGMFGSLNEQERETLVQLLKDIKV